MLYYSNNQMPRKSAKTPSQVEDKKVVNESEVEAEAEVAPATKAKGKAKAAEKPAPKAKAAPKGKAAEKPAPKAKAAPKGKGKAAKLDSVTEETTESDTPKEKATRHVPTSESVEKEFDELIASLDEEVKKLRDSTAKSKGVKFLRTVNKRVKTLKSHALRVSKKKPVTRRNNTNSGFLKPVQISKELAKFTGWDHSELRSRVDVTKFICNYIKEHELQDPADKRNIRVEEDPNLKKLLKFDGKDKKPLTYYRLQTYLKGHFQPGPAVEAPSAAPVAPSKKEKASAAH